MCIIHFISSILPLLVSRWNCLLPVKFQTVLTKINNVISYDFRLFNLILIVGWILTKSSVEDLEQKSILEWVTSRLQKVLKQKWVCFSSWLLSVEVWLLVWELIDGILKSYVTYRQIGNRVWLKGWRISHGMTGGR